MHSKRNGLSIRLSAAIAAALLGAPLAHAQSAPLPNSPQADQAKDQINVTTLPAIVVTANKRPQNALDVPVSASVISSEQLQDLHANSLVDYAAYVPGMIVNSGGAPGETSITLRGIAPISPSATVTTYIDDTPLGSSSLYARGTLFALDLLPYDIEQVEVLRGPQGTLYGAGAMGGIVKYVTRKPNLQRTSFEAGAGLSSVAHGGTGWDARVGFNQPFANHHAALRADFARNDIPGFIDNAQDGQKDINSGTQQSGRVSLLLQPNEQFSWELAAMAQDIDSDNNAIVALDPTTLQPSFGELTNDLYADEPFSKHVRFASSTLKWNLGWGQFVSATGYAHTKTHQSQDATVAYGILFPLLGFSPGISRFMLDLKMHKLTQEFRLESEPGGALQWLAGVFYTNEGVANGQAATAQDFDGSSITAIDPLIKAVLPSTYEETAAFGHVAYDFNAQWGLGAGMRYARNDQDFTEYLGGALQPPSVTPGTSSEGVFTWSISPTFHFNDNTMLYVRAATGYQPGGPNVFVPGVPPTVDSSTLTSYEFGLKSEFADHRARIDADVYRIDWKRIQISQSNGVFSYLTNGGTARSQGFELAAVFKPTAALQLALNAAWTDVKLTEDVPGVGLDGDRLPLVPEWSWSALADYYFPLHRDWFGHVGAGYRWIGARRSGVASNPNSWPMDSYGVVDLNADVSNQNWTLRLYARNLTDKRTYLSMDYLPNPFTGGAARVLGTVVTPRTIGFEVDYRY